ncbi:hypothetical protein SLE2022_325880 [Rubroshorea leprosula]
MCSRQTSLHDMIRDHQIEFIAIALFGGIFWGLKQINCFSRKALIVTRIFIAHVVRSITCSTETKLAAKHFF